MHYKQGIAHIFAEWSLRTFYYLFYCFLLNFKNIGYFWKYSEQIKTRRGCEWVVFKAAAPAAAFPRGHVRSRAGVVGPQRSAVAGWTGGIGINFATREAAVVLAGPGYRVCPAWVNTGAPARRNASFIWYLGCCMPEWWWNNQSQGILSQWWVSVSDWEMKST